MCSENILGGRTRALGKYYFAFYPFLIEVLCMPHKSVLFVAIVCPKYLIFTVYVHTNRELCCYFALNMNLIFTSVCNLMIKLARKLLFR